MFVIYVEGVPVGHKNKGVFMEEYTVDQTTGVEVRDSLNGFANRCHEANDKWWRNPITNETIQRNRAELLMLIVSEISEAMEGERKNLMDDKLPHRRMPEVELADALIRIFDYAAAYGYDLSGAFEEKMQYNATREDHTHAARLGLHGKKF